MAEVFEVEDSDFGCRAGHHGKSVLDLGQIAKSLIENELVPGCRARGEVTDSISQVNNQQLR